MYIIGLDIGTTNWKASLFDAKGREVFSTKTPTITHRDKEGDYYDPEELYKKVCLFINKLVSFVKDKYSIKAISIASMGEAGVLIDEKGESLYPIITWYDKRTEKQIEWIKKNIGQNEINKITGLEIAHIYSLCKLLWLRENKQKIFKRAKKWLCIPDYIIFRLTDEYAMDYSIASRTMLFDIYKKTWSKEIMNLTSISERILPSLFPSGSAVGNITDKSSRETGLAKGTCVVTGGHDHVCGAFAVGCISPGIILDSIGTAESTFTTTDFHNIKRIKDFKGFSIGCHVAKDKYYIMGGLYASSASIEWFIENFMKENNSYEYLIKEAKKSKVGSNGLFFMPHLRGSGPPNIDYYSKGIFLGITSQHKKYDFINAIFEGLAYESRFSIEEIEKVCRIKEQKIIVIGGATKNEVFMKAKVNIINRSLEIVGSFEAVTLGAALLAGIGAGIYKNEDEAIKSVSRKTKIIYPDKVSAVKYDNLYREVYKKLYHSLVSLNHKISELYS